MSGAGEMLSASLLSGETYVIVGGAPTGSSRYWIHPVGTGTTNPSFWSLCSAAATEARVTFTVVSGDWPPAARTTVQPAAKPASTTSAPASTSAIERPVDGRGSGRGAVSSERGVPVVPNVPGNGPGDGASAAPGNGPGAAASGAADAAASGAACDAVTARGAGRVDCAGSWIAEASVGASGEAGYEGSSGSSSSGR